MSQVQESQLDENDPSYVNVFKTLPYFEGNICEGYSKKEVVVIHSILEKLDSLDIFEPLNIDTFLPSARHQRYRIVNNIKEQGLPRYNNSLFSQEYGSSLGYTYFIWKEVEGESRETERCSVIESIKAKLPKYFSRAHKQKAKKTLSLLMMDKITSAQICSIYHELTGDASVSDNTNSKEVDIRLKMILKTCDPSIVRDLRVHNGHKSSFDNYWRIVKQKIEELQATAVDDRRHGLATGFFILICFL